MEIKIFDETLRTAQYLNTDQRTMLNERKETVSFFTPRNDIVCFNVCLYGFSDETLVCCDNRSALCIQGDYEILRVETKWDFSVRQNIVGCIDNEDAVRYGDVLLSCPTYFADRHEIVNVFCRAEIPADALPGKYSMQVKVFGRRGFGGEREIFSRRLTVEVSSVTLKKSEYNLDIWQHCANIARKHEVRLWSEEHFAVLDGYVAALAALGQKSITVTVSDAPWCSQNSYNNREYLSDMFEYGMIESRYERGELVCDYTAMDRYIELCFSHGITEEIELFGLTGIWVNEAEGFGKLSDEMLDGVRIRVKKEDGCYGYLSGQAEVDEFVVKLYRHCMEKGYLDKVRAVVDEPKNFDEFMTRFRHYHELCPKLRYKAAVYHLEFLERAPEEIDKVCIFIMSFFEHADRVREIIKRRREVEYTYYVCCYPNYPNTFLKNPLAEARLIPLLGKVLGVQGFLRWGFTAWPENPREKLSFRPTAWGTGDTCFVYPSRGGYPLLSLRYMNLLRGIGDYQLYERCSEKTQQKVMNVLIKERDITRYYHRYLPDLYENGGKFYSIRYEDYESARGLMIEEMERNG